MVSRPHALGMALVARRRARPSVSCSHWLRGRAARTGGEGSWRAGHRAKMIHSILITNSELHILWRRYGGALLKHTSACVAHALCSWFQALRRARLGGSGGVGAENLRGGMRRTRRCQGRAVSVGVLGVRHSCTPSASSTSQQAPPSPWDCRGDPTCLASRRSRQGSCWHITRRHLLLTLPTVMRLWCTPGSMTRSSSSLDPTIATS